MRNKKTLLVTQLDQKLALFNGAEKLVMPENGWINTIRTAINMTRAQLAAKLNLTAGGVQKIEEREATGQITINKLQEAGKALNMKLVYGFLPNNGSIASLIDQKAENLARKIVLRTHQNMALEDQAIYESKVKDSIQELKDELKREMRKSLWD